PAPYLQPHDARLDHDPTDPRIRATPCGHALEPVSHRLAAADPRAPSLLGPRPRTRSLALTTHLRGREPSAIGPGRCAHHLRDEGSRLCACARAAVARATESWTELESIVVYHGQQIAPTIS